MKTADLDAAPVEPNPHAGQIALETEVEVLRQISEALKELPDDATRLRVIRAVAVLRGIDLER